MRKGERMEKEILIDILRSALVQKPVVLPENFNIENLYKLSKKHDVQSMVSIALQNLEYDVGEKFKKSEILAFYTSEQQRFELNAFSKLLNEYKIPFILLKGAVINKYYPQDYMRTSRDIDVLVYEHDILKIFNLLTEKLSYTSKMDSNDHHRSMETPSGMHIEFHYSLSDDDALPVKNAFDNAMVVDGNLVLDDISFFTYHIIHMAEHFKSGGCGIRSIMDLWVMQNKMKLNFDFRILKSINLEKFAKSMIKLSDVWFGDENGIVQEHNELTKCLQEFIISGGSFGNVENAVAISRGRNSSIKHILNRFFLPYSVMNKKYPILKKAPVLLPVFWFVRLFASLFKGRSKKIINEISMNKNISNSMIDIGEYLCNKLDL